MAITTTDDPAMKSRSEESVQFNTEIPRISVIIPAREESATIADVVSQVRRQYPDGELIVVNDGSHDDTAERARAAGANVITHAYSKGNGASVKTGARAASGSVFVFMDADGQHDPAHIDKLLQSLERGNDMAVGARVAAGQANAGRMVANGFFNRFASILVGHRIYDLTSGFRAVKRDKFLEFLYLLPNGFSYPTTITMAFFRSGYSVDYVPVDVGRRTGRSHINPLRDGMKFLLIIFRVCTLYSPLKVFVPFSMLQLLVGLGHYAYTYWYEGRFTNMSALLLTSALTTFLIGLISEQITALLFKHDDHHS